MKWISMSNNKIHTGNDIEVIFHGSGWNGGKYLVSQTNFILFGHSDNGVIVVGWLEEGNNIRYGFGKRSMNRWG